MELFYKIADFFAENVNIVMILLGVFVLAMLFLLLYLDKRYKDKIRQKKQAEMAKQEEIEKDSEIIQAENDALLSNEIEQEQFEAEIKQNQEEIQTQIEEFIAEDKQEIKEENIAPISANGKEEVIEPEEEKDNAIFDNYESVIKESDAMLKAMQNIIEDNIVEMKKIETQNIDSEAEVAQIDRRKIVSKYKVLYDKVKKDWVVKKEGATRAVKRCKTKEEAIEFAKKCTIDAELGLTFHKKDGKFQKKAKIDNN